MFAEPTHAEHVPIRILCTDIVRRDSTTLYIKQQQCFLTELVLPKQKWVIKTNVYSSAAICRFREKRRISQILIFP